MFAYYIATFLKDDVGVTFRKFLVRNIPATVDEPSVTTHSVTSHKNNHHTTAVTFHLVRSLAHIAGTV